MSDHTELSSEAELSVDTELSSDQKLTGEEQVTTATELGSDGSESESESESIETDVDSAVDAVGIQKGAEVEALVVETREDDTRLNDGLDAAVIDDEVSE